MNLVVEKTIMDMAHMLQVRRASSYKITSSYLCMFTGIIMSKTYGVAKKAKAVSVRVADKDGVVTTKYVK